jgi:CSLREA domain-containing protein
MRRCAGLIKVAAIVALLATGRGVRAERIGVTTTEDELNSDGDCSLREAIRAANTDATADACAAGSGTDEIVVPAGTYTLTLEGRAEDDGTSGDLDLTTDVMITGAGASQTIIQACAPAPPELTCTGIDRVFHVDPRAQGIAATISGVTVRNGQTIGIPFVSADGAGILVQGGLTLADAVVRSNRNSIPGFASAGGGLANRGGTLTVVRSIVRDNDSPMGGGIYDEGTLAVIDSWIRNNTAGEGGGLWAGIGDVSIDGSTVSGNRTGSFGAGIFNYRGILAIRNSTISGNDTPGSGAGIANIQGVVTLNNSTIAANRAGTPSAGGQGPGILTSTTYALVTLSNTIVAGNLSTATPLDCSGTLTSAGYNLIQTLGFPLSVPQCTIVGDTTGNILGHDAELGLLIDNGGPAPTHALLSTSPAIDAGNPAVPGGSDTACPLTDQRGMPRPEGSACDIGAFERAGDLSVSGMSPNTAGNGGSVVAIVYGSGFVPGTALQLARAGETPIAGDPVAIDETGSVAVATFNLTGRAPGSWDLSVTLPDSRSVARSGALTIEATRNADVWIDVIGRDIIRVGRPARFTLIFGNRGNVDAAAVPLVIGVPAAVSWQLLTAVVPPPVQEDPLAPDWDRVPIDVASGAEGDFVVIPLLLPLVPAGFTGEIEVSITAPGELHGQDLELLAGVGDPYFRPDLDAQTVGELSDGAIAYAGRVLGANLPATLRPALQAHVAAQLETMVARGRDAWVRSVGTQTEIYSLSQLVTEAALFGRTVASASPAAGSATTLGGGAGGFARGECIEMGFKIVANRCVPKPCRGIGAPPCNGFPVRPRRSVDPNDKHGALGIADARYVGADLPLRYTVRFENLETASLPAQDVVITDQLDTGTLDLDTLSLGPISFGGTTLAPPPGLRSFARDVDLRPARALIVRIRAALDEATGVLTWRFSSVDPHTSDVPEDPTLGFLPPNIDAPEGEGSVFFTVAPKPGLPSGTEVHNRAAIVFDVNDPIETPEWRNTLDLTAPESHVEPLAAATSSTSLALRWTGSDQGSGVGSYSVYVSENGGPFLPWLVDSSDTAATFTGQRGHTYAFYTTARDRVGNREAAPATADTTTRIVACAGDCDGDGTVRVNELVTGVGIALGRGALAACAAMDGDGDETVRVNELVAAVGHALRGCSG